MTKNKFAYSLLLLSFILITSFCSSENKSTYQTGKWITLFDGESFDGWKAYGVDTISTKWEIEDGMIIVSREGNAIDKNTGFGRSIMTVDEYDNFELELEYRMSPGGNSGLIYHVKEDSTYYMDYETGPEFQLLDDENSPSESIEKRFTASLYDMMAPNENKVLNPAGEWNSVKLIYNNGHVEHWLNGAKVLEYTEGGERWNSAFEHSKWPNFPGWAKYQTGHIALQDHGDFVAFKNIRVRKILN